MTATHLFQNFGFVQPTPPSSHKVDLEEIEDGKLDAFENGYQAGWEDAVAAQSETMSHVSSGFANSLQNASFEYHELRATLNSTVETIVNGLTSSILPQIAQESLGAHIREQIISLSRGALDREIEIIVAPENEMAVQNILSDNPPRPFVLVTDELLAPTQALLKLNEKEIEIQMERAMTEVLQAVSAFFSSDLKEVTDG